MTWRCLLQAGWVAVHHPGSAVRRSWGAAMHTHVLTTCCCACCVLLMCLLCRVEYEPEDSVRILPLCRHYYHPDCIGEWLQRNKVGSEARHPGGIGQGRQGRGRVLEFGTCWGAMAVSVVGSPSRLAHPLPVCPACLRGCPPGPAAAAGVLHLQQGGAGGGETGAGGSHSGRGPRQRRGPGGAGAAIKRRTPRVHC